MTCEASTRRKILNERARHWTHCWPKTTDDHCLRHNAASDLIEIAAALSGYPEDLIHKATGWLLRDAVRADEKRLERFLLQHGARIPRTALRYAIEKFSPEERKQLLAKTKAGEKLKN